MSARRPVGRPRKTGLDPLSPAQERIVATLAGAGRVTTEELIAAVWTGSQPGDALNVLHQQIHKLRHRRGFQITNHYGSYSLRPNARHLVHA